MNNKEEKANDQIDPNILKKYRHGDPLKIRNLKGGIKVHRIKKKERKLNEAKELAARAEILLTEDYGHFESSDNSTYNITQNDIQKSVDISTATKSFNLELTFGPYRFRYTLDGRHLVLAGRLGHLASFDWVTKKLHYEINVMESIEDVCFLHNEEMMAVAQKTWTYIYDKQGVELHCLKRFYRMTKLEFLPYHFLLCGGNENGFLSWLDISLGKEILQTQTKKGRLNILRQNPYNAVLCCGHSNGVVTMWTPNVKEPVLSLLAHNQSLKAIDVDPYGRYMATAALDRRVKIWDARKLCDPVNSYVIGSGASEIAFSQKGLLAIGLKNCVEVYKDVITSSSLYMRNFIGPNVTGLQFSPFEDVLGVSHYRGFSSVIIPGSGEPNFDALERNPYSSRSAKREAEVKSLLRKIPHETITLDPQTMHQVDIPSFEEKLEAKRSPGYVKVPKFDIKPKYRMKGKSDSAHRFARKQKMRDHKTKEFLRDLKSTKEIIFEKDSTGTEIKSNDLLDRFKPKKRRKD